VKEDKRFRIRVLLVDDHPSVRQGARTYLSGMRSIEVVGEASSGQEGIDMARRLVPDMILLDLNLPRKDGREVLAEIKGDGELRRIPVVVLTTSSAEEDVLKAYDLHANCFITKPVDFIQFTMVIKSIEDFWFTIVKLPTEK